MIDTLNSDHGTLENSISSGEPRTDHLVLRCIYMF